MIQGFQVKTTLITIFSYSASESDNTLLEFANSHRPAEDSLAWLPIKIIETTSPRENRLYVITDILHNSLKQGVRLVQKIQDRLEKLFWCVDVNPMTGVGKGGDLG